VQLKCAVKISSLFIGRKLKKKVIIDLFIFLDEQYQLVGRLLKQKLTQGDEK